MPEDRETYDKRQREGDVRKKDAESRDRAHTPDARIQYDEYRREQPNVEREQPAGGPYDVAPPCTPPDKVIVKGEHEPPGPTDTPSEQTAKERRLHSEELHEGA